MDILEIIPIEFKGMSVITAIILFFYAVGFIEYVKNVKMEFETVNSQLKELRNDLEESRLNVADMKTDVALLLQTVTRIEKLLERGSR